MADQQSKFNVVALISGGKDSFFSLLHCIANGHQVVALANLYPPIQNSAVDLNSNMYQTIGHTMIPLYAQALDLPLYRHEIRGTAKDISRSYGACFEERTIVGDEGEETENLMSLLQEILIAHPEVNAVCSGAILSTYQRTRIETVALRLGLVPLSYLWQYPALPVPSSEGLLDDMAAIGLVVRIVKVASGGLDESLLWCDLMDRGIRTKIRKGISRFGGNMLGEGGEYETLVIDGPGVLWKNRLVIDEQRIYQRLDGGSDGAAWLVFESGSGKCVGKDHERLDFDWKRSLRRIHLWDETFEKMLKNMPDDICAAWRPTDIGGQKYLPSVDFNETVKTTQIDSSYIRNLSNLTAVGAGSSAALQMMAIRTSFLEILRRYNCTSRDVVFATIILQSMSDFTVVNAIYGEAFPLNPPARVTFASCLPPQVRVMISFVIGAGAHETLHVQSRSYWAPSNIGPYSQATSIHINELADPRLVFVAGQIPLVPATMRVFEPKEGPVSLNRELNLKSFYRQSCLSLQHLWRIGTEMRVGWWTGAIAFIAGECSITSKSSIAFHQWEELHDRRLWATDTREPEDLDVWDMKYLGVGSPDPSQGGARTLPDFSLVSDAGTFVPGFFAIQVDELPRGCEIEWQGLGISGSKVQIITKSNNDFKIQSVLSLSGNYSVNFLSIYHCSDIIAFDKILELAQLGHPCSLIIYTHQPALFARDGAQIIPCRQVLGCKGDKLAAGVVLHVDSSVKRGM